MEKCKDWFCLNLGDASLADAALDEIQHRLTLEFDQLIDQSDCAVFLRHESEGRLHCELKIYFSPATEVLAKALGARVCAKPGNSGLSLLAGSEKSWTLLFST